MVTRPAPAACYAKLQSTGGRAIAVDRGLSGRQAEWTWALIIRARFREGQCDCGRIPHGGDAAAGADPEPREEKAREARAGEGSCAQLLQGAAGFICTQVVSAMRRSPAGTLGAIDTRR